jgi:hypothetical protein
MIMMNGLLAHFTFFFNQDFLKKFPQFIGFAIKLLISQSSFDFSITVQTKEVKARQTNKP